ncbi:MAG: hypothetical protein NTW19_21670 [Planctomycetota bacterium]|nr:hypothetical protein [Planctomycetota bacterium]
MAIVLPVAMNGLSLALRLGQDARLRGQAATLASGKLEELAATGQWQTGPFSGEFTNDPAATGSSATAGGTVFRWSAVVAPWSVSTMNELTVEVTWTAARHEHSVVVTTLVDPSSSTATGL